jgi:hypothetical protein
VVAAAHFAIWLRVGRSPSPMIIDYESGNSGKVYQKKDALEASETNDL